MSNEKKQTKEDARAEIYRELIDHLQLISDGLTELEKAEAEKMIKRWLPKT